MEKLSNFKFSRFKIKFQLQANQIFQPRFSNFVQNFRSKTEIFQLKTIQLQLLSRYIAKSLKI